MLVEQMVKTQTQMIKLQYSSIMHTDLRSVLSIAVSFFSIKVYQPQINANNYFLSPL